MSDLATEEGVFAYMSTSPWPCTRVERLSGGTGNWTFRAHLVQPYNNAPTVIVKHAKDYASFSRDFAFAADRQHYEALALQVVHEQLGADAVTVPSLLLEDVDRRVLVMSDGGINSIDLKSAILAGKVSISAAQSIGANLGKFLARLHAIGKTSDIVQRFAGNSEALRVSTWATYGRLEQMLADKRIQPPLSLTEGQLGTVRQLVAQRSSEMAAKTSVLTMGDFWPGNVVLSSTEEGADSPVVIDWELVKPGLAGLDIEAATALRQAFLQTYARHAGRSVELARVAAVHAACRKVIGEGVTMMLNAFGGPEDLLRDSIVAELLA